MLTVMAIIGILAAVAIFSTRQSKFHRQMDKFNAATRSAIEEARSRAISRGVRYAVWLKKDSVQWCEDDCPPQPNQENGERYFAATNGAEAVKWAPVADFNLPAMPAAYDMVSKRIYFFPDGTMDSDLSTDGPEGFTVYFQHKTKPSLKRRIVILPLSGEIRKFNDW
jgi:type II secretory pathway pseudopilin PulG